LSDRESSVLRLIALGYSNKEIGADLEISVKTVEGHLTTIYGKFGVASRTQLVAALAKDVGQAPEQTR
jgi:DNA-binding NarL/FixJ family response regulator